MNFILEAHIRNPGNTIASIQHEAPLFTLWQRLGKFQTFIVGNFAFAEPLTFAIMDFELTLFKDYRASIGAYRWGEAIIPDLRKIIDNKLSDVLRKKFSANFKFARSMSENGLYDCNFGSVWMMPGFRGFVYRCLSKIMGRIRVVRRIHSVQAKLKINEEDVMKEST